MENAATDVSKAEELDVAERGRGLTKAELAEFALMRTHALWKHFVQDVSTLQLDSTQTGLDYTDLQLQSGLPKVRHFFLCLVNIKADFPWDFLANYRLAKQSEFGMLQLFLGREMLRDVTGTVPQMHSGWKAPSFLVKALVDNKADPINWEWVYAIVRDVTGAPIPRDTVSRFTDDARYTDVEWLEEVADMGSTVLQAWSVDVKDKLQGSFAR